METIYSDFDPAPYLKVKVTGDSKGPITYASVRDLTYVCIDGLSYYFVQRLSSLRRYTVAATRVHTSNVEVTRDM